MEHLVVVSSEAKELDRLLAGHKTIIIRSADDIPEVFGKVSEGDTLYFMTSGKRGMVRARATVKNVLCREGMNREESLELTNRFLMEMMLTEEQLGECEGKSCVMLVRIENTENVPAFSVTDEYITSKEDWFVLENIEDIKKSGLIM